MGSSSYKLLLVNVAEDVEASSHFDCRDDTDAIIKALEIISRRCQRGIYGAHTLFDPGHTIIAIDQFLDDYGCPQAKYDPIRREAE